MNWYEKKGDYMSSSQSTVNYIVDLLRISGNISARKMFGEYGLYMDGKMFALICDDQLYIKPTPEGRALLIAQSQTLPEAAPYPRAKPCFVITETHLEDADWLSLLIQTTVQALPLPVKKRLS